MPLLKQSAVFQVVILLLLLTYSQRFIAESNTDDSERLCLNCHQQEYNNWLESDHAKAMAIANGQSVLGNFNSQTIEHYGQKATFFTENKQYKVNISYLKNSEIFLIKYTFGFYPLQQYLVETEPGRLQVLPFSWDSRTKEQGGQRWFHNYNDEEISPIDRLHWRQPLQNWNGMCADCHSDGLVRNYNEKENTFDSHWKQINVGCISCHGNINQDHKDSKHTKTVSNSKNKTHWRRDTDQKTAKWQGNKRDNRSMEKCFSCHSLRSPLTDGFTSEKSYLDQFSPQFLISPLYYVDGQIKEEVYVFGSFLQSKMFAAGVNCLDCHQQHSMKIKASGNMLCLQCHSSKHYNTKQHHQHQEGSTGSQCINCHMPQVRYMGVDDRLDHSFKIPRPDISIEFNTPNACVQCHEDQSSEWAKTILEKWFGKFEALSQTQRDYYLLQSGEVISLQQHLAIIADNKLNIITRATALQLLGYTSDHIAAADLEPYLEHKNDLLRLAATNVSALISSDQRVKSLVPLLTDHLKSIRIAAARSLVDIQIAPIYKAEFLKAFVELQLSNEISSWRGEGRVNKSSIEIARKQFDSAEKTLLQAIDIDPFFVASYINLADFYRIQHRLDDVNKVLTDAINKLPKSAPLKYSYGLYLVRRQQHSKSISFFEQAMLLESKNQQYLYAYILSLDSVQQTDVAIQKLKQLIVNYKDPNQLKYLGLYLATKVQNHELYVWFSELK